MDAAIYHPTRNSIFSVRGGYIYEYSLAGVQLAVSKFVNPCFSKSCLAYDSVNGKLWVGTMGDWAAGRAGDVGGALPSQTTGGLYRINPTTLALELVLYPNVVLFGQLDFVGPGYTYNMPSTSPLHNPPVLFDPASGFYDLIYAGGNLWGCLFAGSGAGGNVAIVSFDPTNPSGSNLLTPVSGTVLQQIQCTYESTNVPAQVWFNQCNDAYNSKNPVSVSGDWTQTAFNSRFYNASTPSSSSGGIAYSPVGGGFVYVVQLTGNGLVKYNVDGTINSTPALGGVSIGGQPMRIRYNSYNSRLYIPLPALNQVVEYNPSIDAVSHIYTGLDAPHDCVFSPTQKFAVQLGAVGIKELL